MKNLIKSKREQGFTIIEVMIVLAIAGLIMVIVFIAVPQLQRTQRNTARKDIVGRIKTEIDNYSSNNNGQIPTNQTTLDAITSRYLSGININDPSTGSAMLTSGNGYNTATLTAGSVFPVANNVVNYKNGYKCSGENVATGTARNYALWTTLEGGATYCVDNS